MSSTIVIFGGSGLLGSHIVQKSRERFPSARIFAPRSSELNLLDFHRVSNFFDELPVEDVTIVFNAAKMPYLSSPRDDARTMMENVTMLANFISASKNSSMARLIFISSVDVYGRANLPITEETAVSPASNYAISKYCCELLICRYAATIGIPLIVFRLSHLFGPNESSPKLIPSLIRSALQGGVMRVDGSGLVKRDFVFASDAAAIVVSGIESQNQGLFNLATGSSRSVLDVAETIRGACEKQVSIEHQGAGTGAFDLQFDNSKLRTAFPVTFGSFETQMHETITAFRTRIHDFL